MGAPTQKAAIIGVGETDYQTRIPEQTYAELAQEAARKAIEDAHLSPGDIEAVVYSMAPTEFMGVTDADKWAIDAVFGRSKPFMRVHTGGATGGSAAQAGYMHVASGLYETCLVVGADKVSETPDAQFILNLIWDPFFERDFALNTITMAALQTVRHMAKYGTTEKDMAHVVVSSWKNAQRNPRAHLKGVLTIDAVLESPYFAWPLKRYDCCPRSSGAAAVVIASERVVRQKATRAAWISGVGGVANTVYMGDRMGGARDTDLCDWTELELAAREAYRQAKITDPVKELDVAEIYAPFSSNQLMGVAALGLSSHHQAGALTQEGFFDLGGEVPVNPSGGTLCANPIAVTALVRVCDAALQVLGKAGGYQVPNVHAAVATGVGGSFQFQTCMVLTDEPR
ncbi:MAG: acetyl-CoA acetyltransferase [Sulfobacillus acidophilus]|uniref:Acetyl-CoA acetyltransferase n=1 Tax=Sulfobacillus acidophilus TaxID=53633 RepID=A0A2T2WL03_9FIRM|nr:MAG: acetyl-CoA acetyltransferase [Sulfobacillus acidophilus]